MKIFHVAERYHLPSVIKYAQIKLYVIQNNRSYFTKRFIPTQNIKCKENEWTKFGF